MKNEKYKMKWVTENLGITYDMVKRYQKNGLIKLEKCNNKIIFSMRDLETIWKIKLLVNIGFSLTEISEIIDCTNSLELLIDPKIEKLEQSIIKYEKEIDEMKSSLKHAKMIKLTGKIPIMPKNMGDIRIDEFTKNSKNNFSVDISFSEILTEMSEIIVGKFESDVDKNKASIFLEFIYKFFPPDLISDFANISSNISTDFESDYKCDECQQQVNLLYKNFLDLSKNSTLTKEDFAFKLAPLIQYGGPNDMLSVFYSDEQKRNIANSIAYFGGFKDIEDLLKKDPKNYYITSNEKFFDS